ncbi:serine proteinase stubble isoform X2 [Nilaparvata lugens]|nr:serine proteinase stubble isoform X2 [Nilaparvata lugens]
MKDFFFLLVVILNMMYKVGSESPCPNVFDYEEIQPNEDRWYGVIYLTTKSSLVGVRLDIRFDRPVILMVSWMGEVTSKNSKKFTILSLNEKLLPGPPVSSRFMVKFDRRHGIPELTTIRLNGQKICPPDPDFAIEPVTQNERPIIERPNKVTGNNYGSGSSNSGGTYSSSGDTYSNSGATFSNSGGSYSNSNDRTSTTNRYSGGNSYNTKASTTTERYNSGASNSRPTYNQGSSHTSAEHKPPSRTSTTSTERTYSGSGRPSTHTSSKEDTVQMSYGGSSNTNKKPQTQSTSSGHKPTHTSSQHSGEVYSSSGHKPTHTSSQHSGESTSGSSSNKKTQTSSSTHTILHNVNTNTNHSPSNTNSNKQTKPSSSSNWETNTQSNVKRTTADSNSNRKPDNSWESNTKYTQTSTSQVNKPQSNQRPLVEQETGLSFISECGLVDDQVATYLQSAPVPLITNGRQTTQGQWPWHIALYRTTGPESNYICGGTLITANVVLTAAHCVFNKYDGRPVDPSNLVIYLGKYHLNQYSDDSGVQLKQVREMRVHPDYSSVSYAADIAILILTSPTEYTTFVRPCCLWRSPLQSVEGKTGTVVGWGFDENKQVSQELKMAEMPVVSQRTCIESYRDFFERYASNRTYCAGSRTGVSACNGDSGGGMVFSLGSRWYLRGIVSIAVPKDNKICDPNHFIIFTDVAKYITWINENI